LIIVLNADFHVNYNSPSCRSSSPSLTTVTSPAATFAYDLNSTLSNASAASPDVHHLPVSGGGTVPSVTIGSRVTGNDSVQAGGSAGVVTGKSYGVCSLVGALSHGDCRRENSLLYLLLMLGTVWLGLSLYNFTKTYALKLTLTC
jgi:hypothetical protein